MLQDIDLNCHKFDTLSQVIIIYRNKFIANNKKNLHPEVWLFVTYILQMLFLTESVFNWTIKDKTLETLIGMKF